MTNKIHLKVDSIDLQKLKNNLTRGDVELIRKKTGYSKSTIYKCLNPKNKKSNPVIIKAAVELVDERIAVVSETAADLLKREVA
jgi:hypothetical protein